MKPRRLTLISLTLLATILIGAGIIIVLSPTEIGANVKWDPKTYTWDGTPPTYWNAQISLKQGHKAQTEIIPATILLEGIYSPIIAPYNATHGPRLIVPFSGSDVKAVLFDKIAHMGVVYPGRYRVTLEITGQLIGGETFRGSGVIVVTVSGPGG
ncbi:hypothetical protein DRO69_08000 [Candidatus Bathyarchaeota archaeon]|mgnify:CR=1 FL=1|nr:MAG: hypothetical protein DRO69_08000 [Candidatus Bathyarchaeota archaeon]